MTRPTYQSHLLFLCQVVTVLCRQIQPIRRAQLGGLLFLFTMGILATTANWIGVKALPLGKASVIGSIQYTQLIYASVLGFAPFGKILESYTLIGAPRSAAQKSR